ncbi:LptA/OstA family protein [Synechococcus sp. PCC 7336]|uniref:LptA/OstA family protein n=1 Tax=Synechococcus sp. PCC 7336 TaxID=195250 RepID=UPI0003466258|nr:LptA/OstA family protein [Synechococcus sp. PCC 7336]
MKLLLPKIALPLFGFTSVAGLLAWGILWPVEEMPSDITRDTPQTIELDVDFVGRQAGVRRWRLLADEMRLQDELQIFDRGASGWLYGDPAQSGGSPEDTVFFGDRTEVQWQAEAAFYHTELNRLDLERNVRVFSPDGTLLETETLQVHSDRRIEATQPFILESPEVELSGQSGSFDFSLSELTALQGKVLIAATEQNQSSAAADLQPAPTPDTLTIEADRVDYNRETETASAEGNLVILQGETTIRAPRGVYQRRGSESLLMDGVVLQEPSRVLSSERMIGNHQDKIFRFEQNVVFTQLENPDRAGGESAVEEVQRSRTEVRSLRMIYDSQTKTATFSDSVELIQDGRQARSAEATIEPGTIFLSGNVQLEQVSGEWLARRTNDEEFREALSRPTRIYAERVTIDRQTNDIRFFDRVAIVQANRSAEGDEGIYREASQVLELSGTTEPARLCERGGEVDSEPQVDITGLSGSEAAAAYCRRADRISSPLIVFDMESNTLSTQGPSQFQFRLEGDELRSN